MGGQREEPVGGREVRRGRGERQMAVGWRERETETERRAGV